MAYYFWATLYICRGFKLGQLHALVAGSNPRQESAGSALPVLYYYKTANADGLYDIAAANAICLTTAPLRMRMLSGQLRGRGCSSNSTRTYLFSEHVCRLPRYFSQRMNRRVNARTLDTLDGYATAHPTVRLHQLTTSRNVLFDTPRRLSATHFLRLLSEAT